MSFDGDVGFALLLTVFAGLSTGIGSSIAYFIRKPKLSYLSFFLGFSAGVMLYVSFMELLPGALERLGAVFSIVAFFIGIAFIGVIDFFVPKEENPHHFSAVVDVRQLRGDSSLMRLGILTALAIGIHNFPEGLATFGTALIDLKIGAVIAFAIAIHNIPEGIAVSIPIYYSTGDKKKAFTYSFLSGIAEPVGAVVGFLVLLPFLSDELLASLLAFVAGIMVFNSLDELLPVAKIYERGHTAIIGVVCGMFVMAVSLLML